MAQKAVPLQADVLQQLVRAISGVLIGKEEQVRITLTALLARGHVLIEDIPGVGKTLLAIATARSIGVRFKRVQFTSDTLPSDVIGVNVYNQKTSEFEFKHGPIFTEVLLADEINRTSPRTQSSLLEAMAEGRVSIDGDTYDLASPFMVMATMNPVERFGSFELPESQLDRFMISISLGYPERSFEREILARDMQHTDAETLRPVTDARTIASLQERVRDVRIDPSIMDYLLDVITATREHPDIKLGLSSRAGLHLKRVMQAKALLEGRDFTIPEDLRSVFIPVTNHRLFVRTAAGDGRVAEVKRQAIEHILRSVRAPQ